MCDALYTLTYVRLRSVVQTPAFSPSTYQSRSLVWFWWALISGSARSASFCCCEGAVTHTETLLPGPFHVLNHLFRSDVIANEVLRTREEQDGYAGLEQPRQEVDRGFGRLPELVRDAPCAFRPRLRLGAGMEGIDDIFALCVQVCNGQSFLRVLGPCGLDQSRLHSHSPEDTHTCLAATGASSYRKQGKCR